MHCSLQHSSTIVVADCLFNRKPCRSLLFEKEKNFEASSFLSPIWRLWPNPVRYKRLSFQYILRAIIIWDESQYLFSTGDTVFKAFLIEYADRFFFQYMSHSFSDIVKKLGLKGGYYLPLISYQQLFFPLTWNRGWMKTAIYQLSPGIFRKQMKEFERNKFFFSENGSLNTKQDQHIPLKNFQDCITLWTKILWHISEDNGIHHFTPPKNGGGLVKSTLEKSKEIYEHVGFLVQCVS